MNKHRRNRSLSLHVGAFVLSVITVVICCAGCSVNSFIGSRTIDPAHYTIEFSKMNGQDEAAYQLDEGDTIEVNYQMNKGKLSLTIGMENETPVYSGNFADHGRFTVTVDKAGIYTIHVKAREAAGYLDIEKRTGCGRQFQGEE